MNQLIEPASQNIPQNARIAWERMLAFSGKTSKETLAQAGIGWRLSALSGFERIAQIAPEQWVSHYERELALVDRKQRKKGSAQNGVFYTPQPVARYLVQQSLGNHLAKAQHQIELAMDAQDLPLSRTILQSVQNTRIVDPACGTGVFLVEALQVLQQFYSNICTQFPNLSFPAPARFAFTEQLYGVDLDPLAVWITEARLAQWVIRLDRETDAVNLHPLATNLMAGDSLGGIESLPSEAFRQMRETARKSKMTAIGEWCTGEPSWQGWQGTFPEVAQWDFILGNPPYISEVRGQSGRFQDLRTQESTGYYQAKMDLCDAFLAWALDHLKPGGQLAYVLPEYWTQRTNTASLRKRLWREGDMREFWIFPERPLFPQAPGHHSSLLIWRKRTPPFSSEEAVRTIKLGVAVDDTPLDANFLRDARTFLDAGSGKLLYGDPAEIALLHQLSELPPLLPATQIQQGIVMPQGRLRPTDLKKLPPDLQDSYSQDAGLFLLSEDEASALNLNAAESAWLKPYFSPNGFEAFTGFPNPQPIYALIYMDAQNRERLQNQPENYPNLRAHLERLCLVNTSAFAPYGLHRARQPIWFEGGLRLLCPRQVARPAFAVVDFPAYVSEGFYVIQPGASDPHFLAALLNSRLSWFWLHKQKRKGPRLQVDKDVLIHFPAPPKASDAATDHALAELAHRLSGPLAAKPRASLQAQLDKQVAQRYGLSEEAQVMLARWRP
jgi:hypothetical protein